MPTQFKVTILLALFSLSVVGCGSADHPTEEPHSTPRSTPTLYFDPTQLPAITNEDLSDQHTNGAELEMPSTRKAISNFGEYEQLSTPLLPDSPKPGYDKEIAQYIYRLSVSGCDNEPTERALTGVRVKKLAGIVTALHGVLDCDKIVGDSENANAEEHQNIFRTLKVSQLDLARDIALLVPSLDSERNLLDSSHGLEPANELPSLACQSNLTAGVTIFGYPSPYVKIYPQSGYLRCVNDLKARLPESVEREFIEARKSPQVGIQILDIQANIVDGHSGSAVIQEDTDQLLGIIIGSLPDTVPNGWGIPWREVEFQHLNSADPIFVADLKESRIPDTLTAFFGYNKNAAPPSLDFTVDTISRSSFAIQDQLWTSEYEIHISNIGPFPDPVILVIYLPENADVIENYLYIGPVPAIPSRAGLVRKISVNKASELVRKICSTGEARLIAKLYWDHDPIGIFRPAKIGIPGDELVEFAPSYGWSFRFIIDDQPTYCGEHE